MKLSKLFQWLVYVLSGLFTMTMFMDGGSEDRVFGCFYNMFCNRHSFEFVRNCWLILSSSSKEVIQKCVAATCKLEIPEYYSSDDLCKNNISYDKKRECFHVCLKVFVEYIQMNEKDALFRYSTVYQNLVNAKDCLAPFINSCTGKL